MMIGQAASRTPARGEGERSLSPSPPIPASPPSPEPLYSDHFLPSAILRASGSTRFMQVGQMLWENCTSVWLSM